MSSSFVDIFYVCILYIYGFYVFCKQYKVCLCLVSYSQPNINVEKLIKNTTPIKIIPVHTVKERKIENSVKTFLLSQVFSVQENCNFLLLNWATEVILFIELSCNISHTHHKSHPDPPSRGGGIFPPPPTPSRGENIPEPMF